MSYFYFMTHPELAREGKSHRKVAWGEYFKN